MARPAADAPYAPDLPPDAPSLVVDAAALRDERNCSIVAARVERADLGGGLHGVERLRGVGVTWGDLLELAPALAGALGIRLLDKGEDA